MKKVSLALKSVAVLLVVSSALAFTSNRGGSFYCTDTSGGNCTPAAGATRFNASTTSEVFKYCHSFNGGAGGTCETTTREVIANAE